MRFASWLFVFVLKFGGLGLLILGILDSSFLFAPWGNDLLVVALTARSPCGEHALLRGHVYHRFRIGLPVDRRDLASARRARSRKHLPARRVKRVEAQVRENAGKALAIASLMPPPFPFTAFVMATAALQYSRKRMVVIVGISRMVRFTIVGLLAMRFGSHILRWLKNPIVQGFLIGLIIFCIVGSVLSVYGWIRRSRRSPAPVGA